MPGFTVFSILIPVICILQCTGIFADRKLIDSYCGEILTNVDENVLVSFKSPHYPNASSGDLNCELKILLPHEGDFLIKIDFIKFEMDGQKFGRNPTECDADMFFLKGFNGWTPPTRCGNLTGFSTLIDSQDPRASGMKMLTLLGLMSSSKYRWNIQLFFLKQRNLEGDGPEANSTSSEENVDSETLVSDSENEFSSKRLPNLKSKAILHGKNTSIYQVPWQVSIRQTYQSMEKRYGSEAAHAYFNSSVCSYKEHFHFCGGSIVSPRHILTAAHCVIGESKGRRSKSPGDLVVVVGDTAKCDPDVDSKLYEVEQIIFHYSYDRSVLEDDIAILKLKEEIEIDGTHAKIVSLATEENSYYEGRNATGSGWGLTSVNSTASPNILQSSDNFVVRNSSDCIWYLAMALGAYAETFTKHPKYSQATESVICTGEAEWDSDSESDDATESAVAHTGKGDSGGPLIVHDGGDVQVGITSYGMTIGYGSQNFTMDYFTSVHFFRNWIDAIINE